MRHHSRFPVSVEETMTGRTDPPESRFADTVPHAVPAARRNVLLTMIGAIAWIGLSWGLMWLVGSAWSVCDNISPGGGFALLFLYFPVALVGTALSAVAAAFATRRLALGLRALLVVAAIAAFSMTFIAVNVPIHGETWWADGGPSPDASTQCGAGGIPKWWPSWLPT